MKKLTTSLFAALLALSASGRLAAAEPESSFGLAPSAAPQLPPASSSGLPLIPETPQQSLEKPTDQSSTDQAAAKLGKALSDKTAMAEDKMKKEIALRQAKTKAERDPVLQATYAQALAAHTDFEQRKLFLDYYNGLVDRIAKFSTTKLTKEEVNTMRAQYTNRFLQVRIRPTIDPATFR